MKIETVGELIQQLTDLVNDPKSGVTLESSVEIAPLTYDLRGEIESVGYHRNYKTVFIEVS
jgi:hypothetical protein